MQQMKHKHIGKRAIAESRVGPLLNYFREASLRQLSQREMAAEMGVSRQTAGTWLREHGFAPVECWVEKQAA